MKISCVVVSNFCYSLAKKYQKIKIQYKVLCTLYTVGKEEDWQLKRRDSGKSSGL